MIRFEKSAIFVDWQLIHRLIINNSHFSLKRPKVNDNWDQ
jgi:hypothetical protein